MARMRREHGPAGAARSFPRHLLVAAVVAGLWMVRGTGPAGAQGLPATPRPLLAIAGEGSDAVAVGDSTIWWSSSIHQSWFRATGYDSTLTFTAVVRTSTHYLAAALDGSIWRSTGTDGAAWATVGNAGGPVRAMCVAGSFILAAGEGGLLARSGDLNGATWTALDSGIEGVLRAVAWNGVSAVAVGDAGLVLRGTATGGDWQIVSIPESQDLLTVAADPPPGLPGQYVAAGRGGVVWKGEPDGTTWTAVATGTAANWNGATWAGPALVLTGSGGAILWSAGGFTGWMPVPAPVVSDLRAVCFTGVDLLAAGDEEVILWSRTGVSEWRRTVTPVPVEEESWGSIKARYLPR